MRTLKFVSATELPTLTRGELELMDRDVELFLAGVPEYRRVVEAAIDAAKTARATLPDHSVMLAARLAEMERHFRKLYQ